MRVLEAATNFAAVNNVGPWLKCDYFEAPFNLTAMISYDNPAGTFTLALDFVVGDFASGSGLHPVSVKQTTTTITVTDNGPQGPNTNGLGHGLSVGDYVMLQNVPGAGADGGVYTVASVPTASTYTVTSGVSQTLLDTPINSMRGLVVVAGSAGDKVIGANGAGVTGGRQVIAINAPIAALRLHCSAFTSAGLARLITMQGGLSS